MPLSQTLAGRLISSNGRPSGFDYLRIILASSVILFHSFDLTKGYNVTYHYNNGIFRPLDVVILPMFFSLSGFLISGSLERSKTLISFLGLRAIRLIPALFVETILCAFLIGPYFTTLSYYDYFTSYVFFSYFLNIIGDIHYILPGVFGHNLFVNTVNGQLWTLPWELKCYLVIAGLVLVKITQFKWLFLLIIIICNIVLCFHHFFLGEHSIDHSVLESAIDGKLLVFCFLYGVSLYLLREFVPWNGWVCMAFLPIIYGLLSLPIAFYGDYLSPLPIVYVTVYLGLLEPRRLRIVSSGDYSYGIYLYGFPIQQSLVALCTRYQQYWYVNLGLSLPISALIAIGSWHLVEKRATKLRPALMKFESILITMFHIGKLKGDLRSHARDAYYKSRDKLRGARRRNDRRRAR